MIPHPSTWRFPRALLFIGVWLACIVGMWSVIIGFGYLVWRYA